MPTILSTPFSSRFFHPPTRKIVAERTAYAAGGRAYPAGPSIALPRVGGGDAGERDRPAQCCPAVPRRPVAAPRTQDLRATWSRSRCLPRGPVPGRPIVPARRRLDLPGAGHEVLTNACVDELRKKKHAEILPFDESLHAAALGYSAPFGERECVPEPVKAWTPPPDVPERKPRAAGTSRRQLRDETAAQIRAIAVLAIVAAVVVGLLIRL